MRLAIHYCVNCAAEYMHQWSGSYDATDIPKEYQDKDYCPDCKKLIVDVLATVPKKTEIKWLVTDEVNLETLLLWEKEKAEEHQKKIDDRTLLFPLVRRALTSLTNVDTGETSVAGEVTKDGREYRYFYWPSKPEEAQITVKSRVDLTTGKVVAYY